VSGLNHQFAKLTNGKLFRGFESPPHRQKEVSSLPKQINRCSATVYLFYKAKQSRSYRCFKILSSTYATKRKIDLFP